MQAGRGRSGSWELPGVALDEVDRLAEQHLVLPAVRVGVPVISVGSCNVTGDGGASYSVIALISLDADEIPEALNTQTR